MKRVIDVSIAGVNFSMEEEAYAKLKNYLRRFEASLENELEAREVMLDVEARVAEILHKEQGFEGQVIGNAMVRLVIQTLGDVEEPKDYQASSAMHGSAEEKGEYVLGEKRLFRNTSGQMLSGVCNGIASYFKIDVTLVRLLTVLFTIFYGTALVAYIVFIFVVPKALTVSDWLQMNGYAVSPENINRYNKQYNSRYNKEARI